MSSQPRIPDHLKRLLLANKDVDVNVAADLILGEQSAIRQEPMKVRSCPHALLGDENDSTAMAHRQTLNGKNSSPSKPQEYLDAVMAKRGYCVKPHNVRISPPTPLQVASHTTHVVNAAKGAPELLRALFRAGISPNPCNEHGDSLLHMVCRRGLTKSLEIMIQCGTQFDVSGDGLTPLHEVCWHSPPQFDLVDLVLRHVGYDAFHARDKKGFLPLQYTSASDAEAWVEFLKSRRSVYWQEDERNSSSETSSEEKGVAPALPLDLVVQVANGQVAPEDVWMFLDKDEDFSDDDSTIDSDLSVSSTNFASCDEFSSDDDDSSVNSVA